MPRPVPMLAPRLAAVLAVALAAGCAAVPAEPIERGPRGPLPGTVGEGAAPEPGVHVAFAGGGWRAHTGHAAWTIALLASEGHSLADAFRHVRTVSSNSGGSWFSTMLMYSGPFVAAVEHPDALERWDTADGWLGGQRALFDQTHCHGLRGALFTACALGDDLGLAAALRWDDVVERVVFKDYGLGDTRLSDPRQAWAADKALLLASTILSREVALDVGGLAEGRSTRFYQACLGPSSPEREGGAWTCAPGRATVAPVTFSRLPAGVRLEVPPFLQGAGRVPGRGAYLLAYDHTRGDGGTRHRVPLRGPIASAQVPVMSAAAASSAAGGFAASDEFAHVWGWLLADLTDDEALSVSLAEGAVTFADAAGRGPAELAAERVVRLADGGPTDNSGVAQLVSYLQINGLDDGFEVVAFDHVTGAFAPDAGPPVGTDIATLFGRGFQPPGQYCASPPPPGSRVSGPPCIPVPPLQIFERDGLAEPLTEWRRMRSPTDSTHGVLYAAYPVRTVANDSLGIAGGSAGTLHAFTSVWAEATTAPENEAPDASFRAYRDLLRWVHDALSADGGEGLGHLRRALGLDQ